MYAKNRPLNMHALCCRSRSCSCRTASASAIFSGSTNSDTLISKSAASFTRFSVVGSLFPDSHFATACLLISSCSATYSCDIFNAFRRVLIFSLSATENTSFCLYSSYHKLRFPASNHTATAGCECRLVDKSDEKQPMHHIFPVIHGLFSNDDRCCAMQIWQRQER